MAQFRISCLLFLLVISHSLLFMVNAGTVLPSPSLRKLPLEKRSNFDNCGRKEVAYRHVTSQGGVGFDVTFVLKDPYTKEQWTHNRQLSEWQMFSTHCTDNRRVCWHLLGDGKIDVSYNRRTKTLKACASTETVYSNCSGLDMYWEGI